MMFIFSRKNLLIYFQVLPTEKEMKQDLMNNAIYNEYNVEELETSFRYVGSPMLGKNRNGYKLLRIVFCSSIGECYWAACFRETPSLRMFCSYTIQHTCENSVESFPSLGRGKIPQSIDLLISRSNGQMVRQQLGQFNYWIFHLVRHLASF